jgi:hypothetical protein
MSSSSTKPTLAVGDQRFSLATAAATNRKLTIVVGLLTSNTTILLRHRVLFHTPDADYPLDHVEVE